MRSHRILYCSLASILAGLLLAFPLLVKAAAGDDTWIVHEWGTFTCLQDETGRAIGGINTDDEPLPAFVHNVMQQLVAPATNLPVNIISKGLPFARRCYFPVTMRLETPVLYFHPPARSPARQNVDVDVAFNGGWLSEYYPRADAVAPGITAKEGITTDLTESAIGTLSWKNLLVGGDAEGPPTQSPVWLAPRNVSAANVATSDGESEKYLFYRGVGHLDSPLTVLRSKDSFLEVRANDALSDAPVVIRGCWLVSIRADQSLAFQELGAAQTQPGELRPLFRTNGTFEDNAFRKVALDQLRDSMQKALVKDGLYADEAKAMLDTWEAAYFKTAGTRLFYLVPQAWTDRVLPLRVSVPCAIDRVMVGRIELVTPEHRELLKRIASTTTANWKSGIGIPVWLRGLAGGFDVNKDRDIHALYQKAIGLKLNPASVPENYKTYLDLGRFRDALLLDYCASTNDATEKDRLQFFALQYGINGSGREVATLARAQH
jgi:hypothetical protein